MTLDGRWMSLDQAHRWYTVMVRGRMHLNAQCLRDGKRRACPLTYCEHAEYEP
ncbi:hypothetical protein E2C01_101485 [Portunus trituberculatus]|uniref:Uncharacterized protein n=1 Tax=Portunus trituberculatus TaxID=210409 RepID=A0A5B7KM34_PORTR|nr:hypothetical protein [Portunus trituberculatus]